MRKGDDDHDDSLSLLGEQNDLEKTFDVDVSRRSTMQSNGGGVRLSNLSEVIERFSDFAEDVVQPTFSPAAAVEEINRLRWVMSMSMPAITNAKLPENWAVFAKPRKTIIQLHDGIRKKKRESEVHPKNRRDHLHDLIRTKALKKLESDTFRKLHIIYNTHCEQMKKDVHLFLPSFSPFGWTVEDFIARRHERNTVWLDSLLAANEKDLEMFKFKCDMDELLKLLCLAFKPSSGEILTDLCSYVQDAYEFLKFPQMLKYEAKQNMERLHEQVDTYLDMLIVKRDPRAEAYKAAVEQKLMDISNIGPIELRYEINWMRTKTEQAIKKITDGLDDLERQANEYRRKESKESYCARSALDMYYLDVEKYKIKIAELSERLEIEQDKAENDLTYTRLTLDKMRAQRKAMEEQIVRFHEEIEAVHQIELEEKLAEEEAIRQEELRILEAAVLNAKGKKGKSKDKDKNKKKK